MNQITTCFPAFLAFPVACGSVMRPLFLLATAFPAGCATRTWTSGSKALGDPHAEPMPPGYEITAEPSETDGVAIVGEVTETPQTRMSQFYRTYESGKYDAKDAHRKGNYWLGAAAGAFILPLFLSYEDPDTGDQIMTLGTAATVGLVLATPLVLTGGTQHVAPALPAVRRHIEKVPREWVVEGQPGPGVGLPLAGTFGSATTGPDGRFTLPVGLRPVPDVGEVRLLFDGTPGPQATVDLTSTSAWRAQNREEVVRLVSTGAIADAWAKTQAGTAADPDLMPAYCSAVGSTVTPQGVVAIAKRFGAGTDDEACQHTWDRIVDAYVQAAAPAAATGDLAAVAAALEGSEAVPQDAARPISAIRACAHGAEEADPLDAWPYLQEAQNFDLAEYLSEAPPDDPVASSMVAAVNCGRAVQARRQGDYDRARAKAEADNARAAREAQQQAAAHDAFFADTGLNPGMPTWEAVRIGLVCLAAEAQFGAGCNLKENLAFGSKFCSRNWQPAVKAGGREAAEQVRSDFCSQVESRAIGGFTSGGCYTYRGQCVDFSVDACLTAFKSWCP